jgi:hypothetical protein
MTMRWIVLAALDVIHRIVIPSLLNPTIYPPNASQPEHVLQFFHALKVAGNGDSFEGITGMKDMFVIDGWVRRFVRSNA